MEVGTSLYQNDGLGRDEALSVGACMGTGVEAGRPGFRMGDVGAWGDAGREPQHGERSGCRFSTSWWTVWYRASTPSPCGYDGTPRLAGHMSRWRRGFRRSEVATSRPLWTPLPPCLSGTRLSADLKTHAASAMQAMPARRSRTEPAPAHTRFERPTGDAQQRARSGRGVLDTPKLSTSVWDGGNSATAACSESGPLSSKKHRRRGPRIRQTAPPHHRA